MSRIKPNRQMSLLLAAVMVMSIFAMAAPGAADLLRIHEGFDHGPGDPTVTDPDTGYTIENNPYTDPLGPFWPQSDQAPAKDFVTFNPAYLDHNDPDFDYSALYINDNNVQSPKEKVFKRMWAEKEWFKDERNNGCWDIIILDGDGNTVDQRLRDGSSGSDGLPDTTCDWYRAGDVVLGKKLVGNTVDDLEVIVADLFLKGWTLQEHNDKEEINGKAYDIYGPSIKQEFTYMFLDDQKQPTLAPVGSKIFIPMASREATGNGLDSFDFNGDGVDDAIEVLAASDPDGKEVSADESVTLGFSSITMHVGDEVQLFDNKIKVGTITGDVGSPANVDITVTDNEGPGTRTVTTPIQVGNSKTFSRGQLDPLGNLKITVISADSDPNNQVAKLRIERTFSDLTAGMKNPKWNHNTFIVDYVLYKVVAIKVHDGKFKFITIREKLPKMPIKLYGVHLTVWGADTTLPEMPPFNMDHKIIVDIDNDFTKDKFRLDTVHLVEPLNITYASETDDLRLKGVARELYHEGRVEGKQTPICVVYGLDSSGSMDWNDPLGLRKQAAKDFTDKLNPLMDLAGVVSWDDNIDFSQPLTNNFTLVKNQIDNVDSSGMTNLNAGLTGSINVMDGCTTPGASKAIIFLTDGVGAYTPAASGGPASVAASKGYKIFSIGLGPSAATGPLQDMANATGGQFFAAPNASVLQEIFDAIFNKTAGVLVEHWDVEWFQSEPIQYTQFRLPAGQEYLVTTAYLTDERRKVVWDSDPTKPIGVNIGVPRAQFKFDPADNTGLWVNETNGAIRLYGTYNQGPGNHSVKDPDSGHIIENSPYTDQFSPFWPNLKPEIPEKDFITFNPAYLDHNDPDFDYSALYINDNNVQSPKEKVFKRMWYEKEWFKDENDNGCWDILLQYQSGRPVRDRFGTRDGKQDTVCDFAPGSTPDQLDDIRLELFVKYGIVLDMHNNDPLLADIYGPSIKQEFTYMFLDDQKQPTLAPVGSKIFIPMASREATGNGLDSFDFNGDGVDDAIEVLAASDPDGKEVSADESVTLGFSSITMHVGDEVQLFDNKIKVGTITGDIGSPANVDITVTDNEGPGTRTSTTSMTVGTSQTFSRGHRDPIGNLKITVISADSKSQVAKLRIERTFNDLTAGMKNPKWNHNTFIVDYVLYKVTAIKVHDGKFKFITIREKLPKTPIKLYGVHLTTWNPGDVLPELPPYNMDHKVLVDIDNDFSDLFTRGAVDKFRLPAVTMPPLEITYTKESEEERLDGVLREIYWETCLDDRGTDNVCSDLKEHWAVEWFWTNPKQYTEFLLPQGQEYLVTTSWFTPEGIYHLFDSNPAKDPVKSGIGMRLKFKYDPAVAEDIYINGGGSGTTPTPTITPTPTPPPLPGDANGDGCVNAIDFNILSGSWMKSRGDPGYNDSADFYDDDTVNSIDFNILSENWGKCGP